MEMHMVCKFKLQTKTAQYSNKAAEAPLQTQEHIPTSQRTLLRAEAIPFGVRGAIFGVRGAMLEEHCNHLFKALA
jgi:hypothetical protein